MEAYFGLSICKVGRESKNSSRNSKRSKLHSLSHYSLFTHFKRKTATELAIWMSSPNEGITGILVAIENAHQFSHGETNSS